MSLGLLNKIPNDLLKRMSHDPRNPPICLERKVPCWSELYEVQDNILWSGAISYGAITLLYSIKYLDTHDLRDSPKAKLRYCP